MTPAHQTLWSDLHRMTLPGDIHTLRGRIDKAPHAEARIIGRMLAQMLTAERERVRHLEQQLAALTATTGAP